jgi:hypothetical protein
VERDDPDGPRRHPRRGRRSIAFLLFEDSSFLTGVSLLVDGGLMYA